MSLNDVFAEELEAVLAEWGVDLPPIKRNNRLRRTWARTNWSRQRTGETLYIDHQDFDGASLDVVGVREMARHEACHVLEFSMGELPGHGPLFRELADALRVFPQAFASLEQRHAASGGSQ